MTIRPHSDNNGTEKSVDEKITGQDSAPKEGVEREDAQPSHPDDIVVSGTDGPLAGGQRLTPFGSRTGMWASGTGDTSGYTGIERTTVIETAQRPYGGWYDQVADRAAEVTGKQFQRVIIDRDEITFVVAREDIATMVRAFRDDPQLRYEVCVSVSGVHYPQDQGRELHVVYHLLSITHNRRVRLEVTCPDADPHVPSVVATYPMADYHERETWDMFGVIFDGHPALTRILMPDDWQGHPQRKDYPLGGISIEYKGATVPSPDQRRSYNR